jgi:hypothetical protein
MELRAPGSGFSEHEINVEGEVNIRKRFLDSAVALAMLYRERVLPSVRPVDIEKYFRIDLKSRSFGFAGTMDLLTDDGIDDLKTKRKSPTQRTVDDSIQLTIYGLGYRLKMKRPAKKIRMVSLIETNSGTRSVDIKETHRGDEEVKSLLMRAELFTERVKAGVFMPAPVDHWKCSGRWCSFYYDCPFGSRARSRTT